MGKKRPLDTQGFRTIVAEENDVNAERIHYCYQIGSTFVHLSLLEDSIINAMSICDRIKVSKLLGADTAGWELIQKRGQLQSSTLGNLISILSKHGVADADIAYLKWVKLKRDFFIHRFFNQGAWPGDLGPLGLQIQCRKLLFLEIIFARASNRIWKIFGRANLMEYIDLGADGALMLPMDLAEKLES